MNKMLACALVTVSAASLFAADDTMIRIADTGTTWGNTNMWQSQTVPSGPGVVVDTGSKSLYVRMDQTNRVVGGITSTYGIMPQADSSYFFLTKEHSTFRYTDEISPIHIDHDGYNFAHVTNSLVFNNNGNTAFISIDDAYGSDDTNQHDPFRYFFDVPVILEDDLLITHEACHTNKNGNFELKSNRPAYGVIFADKVSGDKNIAMDVKTINSGVAFRCDDNDFTGDIDVKSGMLRAKDLTNLPRVGTPFGRDNHIYATNGAGRVDLGGFITGAGQTLHLGGYIQSAGRKNGALFTTWAEPGVFSEWQGDVILDADAWIGGTVGGDGYPTYMYPIYTHGDIEISGSISDGGDSPKAIHLINLADVVFSGDNTFSGGLYLDSGAFTARKEESLGTGGIYWGNGVYKMTSNDDYNILDADIRQVSNQVRIFVDEGVVCTVSSNASLYALASRPKLYKTGCGDLLLTNHVSVGGNSQIANGRVIFDTTYDNYVKFGPNYNSGDRDMISLLGDVELIATGNPDVVRTASYYGGIATGAAVTMRAEKNQEFKLSFTGGGLGYVNLETDDSDAYFTLGNATLRNYEWLLYGGYTWAKGVGGKATPVDDSAYSHEWNNTTTDMVDVVSAVIEEPVPAGTAADVVRFNTPLGTEAVLTLEGDLTLAGGTILMTANTGTTSVRITGGTLKSGASYSNVNCIRILNFNTNATLTIESDISGTAVVTGGPGKIVIKGSKSYSGNLYITGGETEINSPDSLGSRQNPAVNVYNGAIFAVDGSFDILNDSSITRTSGNINFYTKGGYIKVADKDDTLSLVRNTSGKTNCHVNVYGEAKIGKLGAGTLYMDYHTIGKGSYVGYTQTYMDFEVLEGTLETKKIDEGRGRTIVKNGAVVKGSQWARADLPGSNGGGTRSELQAKRGLKFGEGGGILDVATASNNMIVNDTSAWLGLGRVTEAFKGTGDWVITNSVGTGTRITFNGYRDTGYSGKLTSYLTFMGGGLTLPNTHLHIPEGVSHTNDSLAAHSANAALGNISGSGTLYTRNAANQKPSFFFLGRDISSETVPDFSGKLLLCRWNNVLGNVRLIKVGSNSQRLSGSENFLESNPIIREGTLLVGNDSPGDANHSGVFGLAKVFVGDEETPADASPSLLIDGAYDVGNEIRILPGSPESAKPTIGGTANANGATFSGKVKLYRDTTFTAGENATVTFSGDISMEGEGDWAIEKTGAGTVEISAAVVNEAGGLTLSGGTLDLDGTLEIPEGAVWSIGDYIDLCTKDNRKNEYTLITADSIVGKFNVKETLPLGWKIVTKSASCVLRYGDPPTVILVR